MWAPQPSPRPKLHDAEDSEFFLSPQAEAEWPPSSPLALPAWQRLCSLGRQRAQPPFSSAVTVSQKATLAHLPKESVLETVEPSTKQCRSGKGRPLPSPCLQGSPWAVVQAPTRRCVEKLRLPMGLGEGHSPASRLPVAAVQPMTGGMAPTMAPTQVLAMLSLFNGV